MGGATSADRSPPAGARGKARRRGRRRPYGADFEAWDRHARRRIREASGLDVEREARKVAEPVQRSRRMAEVAAPALMRLLRALSLGVEPTTADAFKGGLRLMADIALRKLAMVGVKSGDALEHDVSDRMAEFLQRFTDPARAARAQERNDDDDVEP